MKTPDGRFAERMPSCPIAPTSCLSEVHAHYMLRNEKWKTVVGRDGKTLQLFDLENDPLEQVNLCGHPHYQEEELEMRSRLLERITSNTLRLGEIDPELSAHGSDE